jgi:signal transduction histidine kinase
MTGVLVIAAVQFLASVTRELARERDEKQAVAAQEERARIAREIHDGIAQSVYMLSLNLETTAEKAEPGSKTGDAVRELVPLSKQILMEVRHYIFDLKPLLEGGQSLQEALSNQTREFASVTGISIDLNTEPTPDTLTSDASIAIYRTVQEALANAYRHGGASHVSVNLAYGDGLADLVIDDDGTGFDVGQRAKGLSSGYGLRNMEERALDLGGFVEIQSDSGKGTRVRMALPFDA